jgi:hypothetical protein
MASIQRFQKNAWCFKGASTRVVLAVMAVVHLMMSATTSVELSGGMLDAHEMGAWNANTVSVLGDSPSYRVALWHCEQVVRHALCRLFRGLSYSCRDL